MRFFLSLTLLLCANAFGQQDASTTLFWNSYTYYNPAMAGLQHKSHGAVHYPDQWDGFDGAPKTLLVNANGRINEKHGIGVNYLLDKVGISTQNTANLNYNYQLKLKNEQRISFGLAVGLQNFSLDQAWVPPTTETDPFLPQTSSNDINVNVGVAYKTDKLLLHAGATQLTQERISSNSTNVYGYKSAPHLHLGFEYIWSPIEKFSVIPRVLASTDFVKHTISANAVVMYNETFWAGGSLHLDHSVGFMLGWNVLKKYRIAYAYDHSTYSPLTSFGNSHEIVLGVFLK